MNRILRIIPLLLIVLAPAFMLSSVWSNPVSAGEDDVVYYYPLRVMVSRAIREGRWPMDNPYEATGTALMADPQSAVMHPATWLFALCSPKLAYSLSVFLAFSAAGAGAYLYLRRIGLIVSASVFGAMAFMFCGFMVGHRVHLSMIQTAAMLPWGLWCIELARKKPLSALLAATPVVFLALTAGHWPTFIHVSLIWGSYFLFRGRPILRATMVAGGAVALALIAAAPQIAATSELLSLTTRQRIGIATAGENSFLPVSAVHAVFPMLMGSRTPNFFPQKWWGPWHLCEMLGYVGLLTLVLAFGAAWRLYRRPESASGRAAGGVVRCWTWIAVAAGVFMLGYYLPTYRMVHAIPVLGVLRCPARMVLAVEMALASLAAIAIHAIATAGSRAEGPAERLARTVRRGLRIYLPTIMALVMLAFLAAALLVMPAWSERMPWPMNGGAKDILEALHPSNPAVWVQWAILAASVLVAGFWMRAPSRRALVLVPLLMADLFFLTAFVDVPGDGATPPDPQVSPAARWLAENAPKGSYRVWGLGENYHYRPAELLLPKTGAVFGVASIANYGPFQSPEHARRLGFRIFGFTRNWRSLLGENRLLSLCNVRYILCEASSEYERVLQSVRMGDSQVARLDGPELLAGKWRLNGASLRGKTLRLEAPWLWSRSSAERVATIQPETVYRLSLEARGPLGGAAGYLRAEIVERLVEAPDFDRDPQAMMVYPEQIDTQWRRFDWIFETPGEVPATVTLRVYAGMGERPVEVRRVSLRQSNWPQPVPIEDAPGGVSLLEGENVYWQVAELDALDSSDRPIVIYENVLAVENSAPAGMAIRSTTDASHWLKWATIPAAGLYLAAVFFALRRRGRTITRHRSTSKSNRYGV